MSIRTEKLFVCSLYLLGVYRQKETGSKLNYILYKHGPPLSKVANIT